MVEARGQFPGRTVVVTAAAGGNGRAVAQEFAQQDADTVVIADVQEQAPDGGPNTAELIRRDTRALPVFIHCNLSASDQIAGLIGALERGGGVDVLTNNAGAYPRRPLEAETADSFDRMQAVNVRAPFLLSQECAQMMAERGGGAILNFLSGAASQNSPGYALYTTAKTGLHGQTIALAAELANSGIRVNAIVPGRSRTAMTMTDVPTIDLAAGTSDTSGIPLGRYGEPAEVARACAYLASDHASISTGASLIVDGGTSIISGTGRHADYSIAQER